MPEIRRLRIGRLVAIAAVCLALVWLSATVGLVSILRARAPEQALALAPWDARANGLAAFSLISADAARSRIGEVNALAKRSIGRDPTYVPALVALGIAREQSGDVNGARLIMNRAATLSKRDLPTRLWLIEERVAAGDVPGALYHYDIALRTSPSARPLLFPILIRASGDPQLATPIAKLLAKKPDWAFYFFPQFISQAPSKAQLFEIVRQMTALGARPSDEVMKSLIQELAGSGQFDLAYRAYGLAGQRPATKANPIDDKFDREGRYPPIDWQLSVESPAAPAREIRAGRGSSANFALFFTPGADANGVIASRLVNLSAGSYRFAFDAGGIDSQAQPFWTLTCADDRKTVLWRIDVQPSPDGERHQQVDFAIPPKRCALQTLALSGGPGVLDAAPRAWVDNVSIMAVP